MSSKVLGADDSRPVEAMKWRTAAPGDCLGALFPEGQNLSGADAARHIEQRVREAHAAGVREGEAAGQRRAAELQPVLERLARSIEEISGLRDRLRHEAEQDLVRLALAIARRVLRRELAVDADAIHGLVLGALERLQSQEICRVRVHPAHEAAVSACLRRVALSAPIEVLADPSREPGSVVFETGRGSLDASVESQLQEIERGLADRLRRRA
jgi:flagellar assembly protein FliH